MAIPPSSPAPFGEGAGFAALHDAAPVRRLVVAPTTEAEINTIRFRPIPIACARLNQQGFDFDSSFVTPTMASALSQLGAQIDSHPKAPLSVFGHADPVGDDEYNKRLSGRRAGSVFGLLTRDTDLWEDLYQHPAGGDDWKPRAVGVMLGHLKDPDGVPYDEGHPGKFAGVVAFQKDNGLTPDGSAGPKTRKVMFALYMDAVCVRDDASTYSVPRESFIGGGADPDGKGSHQGCSEFNPVFLFAAADASQPAFGVEKEERDRRNGVNRRVLIFLFQEGASIPLAEWPCPRAKEPGAGCKSAFWPDGEERRTPGPAEREYRATHDTMACRFYDGMARRSPCEGVTKPPRETLVLEWPEELSAHLPAELALRLVIGKRTTISLWSDGSVTDARRRFVFDHVPPGARCTLFASTGEVEIRLWNDQRANVSDDPPSFERWLEELLIVPETPKAVVDLGPMSTN